MKILSSLAPFIPHQETLVLTIGNFDGVHIGHQALLKKMQLPNAEVVLITFSNHPADVLLQKSPPRLITLNHKLYLLEALGISTTFLLPFTKVFARQTAEQFLISLKKTIPFTHLLLGHDAVIGHERKGDRDVLYKLAKRLSFHLEYIDPVTKDEIIVSSSRIRHVIQQGHLTEASSLFGRPYSLISSLRMHDETTALFPIEGLCLPPLGHYQVEVRHKNNYYRSIAILRSSYLELAFFIQHGMVDGDEVEVIF